MSDLTPLRELADKRGNEAGALDSDGRTPAELWFTLQECACELSKAIATVEAANPWSIYSPWNFRSVQVGRSVSCKASKRGGVAELLIGPTLAPKQRSLFTEAT